MLLSMALVSVMSATAQKIDFNNTTNWAEDRLTETGFTAWPVGTETGVISKTVDGVTITIQRAADSAGGAVKGNWWKDGVQRYSKLIGDGIAVYGYENGETPQVQAGAVAITVKIEGLSTGSHSLMAYHNNTDGYNAPKLKVSVDGIEKQSEVVQSNRAQKPSDAGMSYIVFQATEGQAVTVRYETVPDPAFDYKQGYNTTTLFINSLVFDRPNPVTTAADPYPANNDEHANADNGTITLAWTAASSAVKHHVFLGNAAGNLEPIGTPTAAEHQVSGLSALKTYYWRVDEEDASGNIYQGNEWSFRPRRDAFAGAEGYGRYAIGGRGGSVYHVTSLDDDVDNPQPGTFRYGITKVSGPRTIVFDVAGVITLKGRLTCSDKYVTIAGQTAPGNGIMLTGAPFGMGSDGITQFIRARIGGGDDWDGVSPNPRTSDGIGMAGNDHSIMDHCSVSWTIDEAFSSRNAKNVTLQKTLISETLNQAGHKNYVEDKGATVQHGYAATIGGDYGSYHHNLLAHNEGRNWSMSGGLDGGGAYAGHHDMFNNVVYNWGNRATDGGTHEGNFVNNYYKMGPATTKKVLLTADLEGTGTGSQAYYVNGNIRENLDGSLTHDALNETYAINAKQTYDWTVFVAQPFFESQAVIESAEAALKNVLSDVGCNMPFIDNHDARMISETLNGTTSTIGSRSGKKGIIDKESDSEGFAGLNITQAIRPAGYDSDQDGMPDWFEDACGLDKNVANNNAETLLANHTDLEQFLEFMAHPHFIIKKGESVSIPLAQYFAGYKNANYSIVSSDDIISATVTEGNASVAETSAEKGVASFVVSASEGNISLQRKFVCCFVDELPETETSGISDTTRIKNNREDKPIYNISGQRLQTPQKGINIIGGKKVVIK